MNCQYCNTNFSTKTSLNTHQKTAKYCLKLRQIIPEKYICPGCNKDFTRSHHLERHRKTCKVIDHMYTMEEEISILKNKNNEYEIKLSEKIQTIQKLEQTIKDLQNKLENIAIKAVSRPTTKNTQINNYIQKLECVTDEHLHNQAQHLTIEHIQKGPEGYAEYALEYPLKNRIVCVDYARRKVKFKDPEGNVITDPEMSSLATKLFESIKDRNKDLIMEYGAELRDRFGEEMDTVVKLLEYKSGVDISAEGSRPEFLHDFVRSVCGKTIPE